MLPPELGVWIHGVEASCRPGATHHELAEAFRGVGQDAELSEPYREAARWFQALYEFMLSFDSAESDRWGGALVPCLVFPPDHIYPPPVSVFSEEAVEAFKSQLAVADHPAARARLADFLWLRQKQIDYVDVAVTAYLDAGVGAQTDEVARFDCLEYLQRALVLSRSTRRMTHEVRPVLVDHIDKLVQDGNHHDLSRIVDFAASDVAIDPEQAGEVLTYLRRTAEEHAGGRLMERAYLCSCITLASCMGQPETAGVLRQALAHSLEAEGDERAEAMIQSTLYQEALAAYQALGMVDDLVRIKEKLHTAGLQAHGQLGRVEIPLTIPMEQINSMVEQVVAQLGLPGGRHLLGLAASADLWPDWPILAQRSAEHYRNRLFGSLGTRVTVAPDGRTFPWPDDPERRREANEAEYYTRQVVLCLALLRLTVDSLRERGAWGTSVVLACLAASPLYPPTVCDSIKPGIEAFEEGRYWEALHVLTPRVEAAIRALGQALGEDVYSYDSRTGQLRWVSLDKLLARPGLAAGLNAFRNGLTQELAILLTKSPGPNLRNEVAHGLISRQQSVEHWALLLLLILILLSAYTAEDA